MRRVARLLVMVTFPLLAGFLLPVVAQESAPTTVALGDAEGYRALEEIVLSTDTRLEWDAYAGAGTLVRGQRSLAFSIGSEVLVVDYRQLFRAEPVLRRGSSVLVGPEFVTRARQTFPPPEVGRRVGAIFIDAGHGGRDPGAIGVHRDGPAPLRLEEKAVALDVALALRQRLLEAYPDRQVILSRADDRYLTLEERTNLANDIQMAPNESVVFLSIHANASLNRSARGFEVWYLPPEFRRRNLVDPTEVGVDDPGVLSILNTIREEEITIESVLLARNVLSGMESTIGGTSPNRGLREESWYVVRNARMPSILVEVGFVTNSDEARLLADPVYLQRVTNGIYTGVLNFVRSFENVGTE